VPPLVTNKQFCAFGITFDDVSYEVSQRVLAPHWCGVRTRRVEVETDQSNRFREVSSLDL
jgi:hypothetical protein